MSIDFTEKSKRYQAIDEIIASGRKLKWNEIIQELGEKYDIKTSRTSFFRDIEELTTKYAAPIDTDFETSGYFYTAPHYRLPRFYTDQNAAQAAKLIKTLMDLVKDNPIYNEAQQVFESLATENHDFSIDKIRINKPADSDRIIFLGAPNKQISAEMFRLIGKALNENLVITFEYQSYDSDNSYYRRVQPFQLIFDNGNWNLHGLDVVKNATRRYTLSKMKDLQLTKEVFTLPKDYDFRKMVKGHFGCVCHEEAKEYKIHLHGYAANYAKDRIWGENQKIEVDEKNPGPENNGIILSFRSNQFMSICRWVWQWVDEAWPIEPEELVDDWEEKKKKMNSKNFQK